MIKKRKKQKKTHTINFNSKKLPVNDQKHYFNWQNNKTLLNLINSSYLDIKLMILLIKYY